MTNKVYTKDVRPKSLYKDKNNLISVVSGPRDVTKKQKQLKANGGNSVIP